MSYCGSLSANGDEERNHWSRLSQTLASNVHKISQNVNQIQRLINELQTSEDSDDLMTQLHSVRQTSAQLTRDTNSYLKELSQLPQLVQSMASVDQNRRNPLINSYNNRKTNFVFDNNNSKQFSVEKFMTPSSIVSKKSNFYEGKTVFGGANASRAARLAGTTPYNLLQRHHLAPVLRVNVEASKRLVESSEPLSSSSQRILEKLEKASTPLQDARRIPTTAHLKSYFQSSDLLHRSTKRPKLGANPVFNQTISEQPFQPKRWELKLSNIDERKVSATETTDQLINSCDNKYLSDSIDNKSNETFGGKIMRKDIKREEKRTKPLAANGGQIDDLDLLTSAQPLKMPSNLPKFNFGSNSSTKPRLTTEITKITSETQELSKDFKFKFSEPSLKIKDQKSESVLSELRTGKNGKKPFIFSSPLSAITHKSSNDFQKVEKESNVLKQSTHTSPQTNQIENKSEPKKREDSPQKWMCVCLFQNICSDTKCKACKKDRSSQLRGANPSLNSKLNKNIESNDIKSSSTPIAQNSSIGWGNQFKAPVGSWTCSECMVSNPSDKIKCVACEVPKPGATPLISTSGSQWGNKFKPPSGSWSCSDCMVSNPSDKTKCVACEAPKPGATTSLSTNDSPKSKSSLWQCFYCQHNNEMSKTVCTSCAKIKTAVATKEDLNKLYGKQTFKFGVTDEKKDIQNKGTILLNEEKTDISNKPINSSIFSKPSESTPQISTSNSFVFGSTAGEEKNKLSDSFVPKPSNPSDSLFKFGAPQESSKPVSEVNPTEKSNTNIADIFGLNKGSNASFSFGTPSTTSLSTPSTDLKSTVDSSLFVFGSQSKDEDSLKTKKNVSFELESKNKSTSDAFTNKSSTDSTPLSFQISKPSEDKQQMFKSFNSSSSGSLFGLTSSTTKDAAPVTTVTTVSITSFMDNKFTSKSNESQNKNMSSLFGGPTTTTSASFSSPFSLTNSFSGQKSTPTTGQNAVSVANDTKSLFSLTPSSTIKSFDSIISSQTNPLTTSSSTTPTAPLGLSNSSSQQKGLVFGSSNPSLQPFSSQSSAVTTKPNFSFNMNANTGANTTATTTDSAFGSNASTLFGSNPSKGFNFGTSSLNSSQSPAFSFTIPSSNSLSNTSSNLNFGLNSNAINTTSADTNTKTANSLFAFGGQNSDQSFTSPLTQKPSNNTNNNSKTSSQFSFGLSSNPSTGQTNSNLFANAINPTQNSLSFNQMSGTATAANPSPFTFGGFGTTPSPAGMPQLQNQVQSQQQQQQPSIPPPAFNFSAQPSFDFASLTNASTPSGGPVFQFSAEQTSGTVAPNRNIKKAKRRLNPT